MNIFVFFLLATRGGNGNTTAGGNGNTARAQLQDLNPLSLERKNPLMLRMFGELNFQQIHPGPWGHKIQCLFCLIMNFCLIMFDLS